MKDHAKKLEEKIQEIVQELEANRESNTPRPEWDKCGVLIEGGAERWRDIADNKSSSHLLEILISELDSNSKSDFNGYVKYKHKLKKNFNSLIN